MTPMKRFRLSGAMTAISAILLFYAALVAGNDNEEPTTVDDARLERTIVASLIEDTVTNLVNEEYRTVEPIIRSSCYNCHSAHTDYPWYYRLPFASDMIDDHIKEGREHLDFTDGFPFTGSADQIKLLREIREEIADGQMPPLSYRLMHWGSKIEGEERDSVFTWIQRTIELLEGRSPN